MDEEEFKFTSNARESVKLVYECFHVNNVSSENGLNALSLAICEMSALHGVSIETFSEMMEVLKAMHKIFLGYEVYKEGSET